MQKSHNYTNNEIVQILKEILAAMEVKNVNRFRIRAYQNAISAIENLTLSVQDLWENHRLDEIPGVGEALEQHLTDLFTIGEVADFISVKDGLPEGMFSLIGIRGIGAKKAYKLADAFGLTNREAAIEDVKKAAEQGKIRDLEGFGEKSEADILEAINQAKQHKREKQRMLLVTAEQVASRILDYLRKHSNVERAEALGSLRRREATVGDLDIAVATTNPSVVLDYFVAFPEIGDVINKGDKKASVELKTQVQVDVRVIEPHLFGSMMQYFTGSKQHNVILRTYALEKGYSLSEYGIKKGSQVHEFATEEAFYQQIGLPYISPEIRQGKNEVDLAKNNKLPQLVELADIKGDIHLHTNFSDGTNTLEEMVAAGKAQNYDYIGISDHSPSVSTNEIKDILNTINTRRKQIEQLNSSEGINILLGYEVNILVDASLSLPNEVLKELDYVIASVHTSFKESKEQQTKRLLAAIENPYVKIIGHPTGRLINERQGIDLDWMQIFQALKDHNKILEINSQPNRLDLPDDLVHEAVKMGIPLIINTDSHDVSGYAMMRYGIDVARRGWCTKADILNTLPFAKFVAKLKA